MANSSASLAAVQDVRHLMTSTGGPLIQIIVESMRLDADKVCATKLLHRASQEAPRHREPPGKTLCTQSTSSRALTGPLCRPQIKILVDIGAVYVDKIRAKPGDYNAEVPPGACLRVHPRVRTPPLPCTCPHRLA